MRKKELLMGIIMSVIISTAMGALSAFLVLSSNPKAAGGRPVAAMYAINILLAIAVGIVVSLVVPLGKLGRKLTKKAGAQPPSIKFILLNSIPMAVGNSVIVGLIVSLFGVIMGRRGMPPEVAAATPFIPMWLGSWIKLLIPTLIISYVLSVLLTPVISRAIGLGGPPKGKGSPDGRPR